MSKRLETVATMTCLKTLLMLFNFVFWVSGMLMLCIGIWLRIQMRDYVSGENNSSCLLAISSLGLALALAATLACCCTARGHPALLYLYGAFLAVVALLEFGVGASAYAFRASWNEEFDQSLNQSMAAYGQNDAMSNHIDYMQMALQCCGNRGYADWLMYPQKQIPQSCCKLPYEENKCDTSNVNQIFTEGCYNRMIDFMTANISLVAGTAIGMAFFPLVGVFLACCLASNINKAEYEHVA